MNDLSTETIERTIELELAILVRRITSISKERRLGPLDRSAYLLLHQISSHGSAGVKALAEEFHLDISTISRQAAALELKGYVRRKPDPMDRRAYHYEITETGYRELQESRKARMDRVRSLIGDWPEEEKEQFGRLLAKFNRIFLDG